MIKYLLFFLLIFIFLGCSTIQNKTPHKSSAQIINNKEVCNVLDDECKNQWQNAEKVEILNPSTLRINTSINCCADLEIVSIEKENDKIILNLIEAGLELCECGGSFIKSDISFDDNYFTNNNSLSTLEIFIDNENAAKNNYSYYNGPKQFYP